MKPENQLFMEQSPDSAEEEEEESLTEKLHELLDESDSEETGQFCFREETVEEVMQEFYKEIAFSAGPLPPNPSPYPSPVFINDGQNGSCGASVSDSASTVMAGIEVVSPAGGFPVTENGSTVVEVEDGVGVGVGVGVGEEKKMEGLDGGDLDDEWVGRVLSWGQQNQVQVVDARQWWL